MAVTSGFFNSVSGDRTYDAPQMGDIFKSIITDGVLSTDGDQFIVTQNANNDMTILVGSGKAWSLGKWLNNDSAELLVISDSFATLNRIDTIVLDFDLRDQTRDNTIQIVEGTLAASPVPPTLVNDVDHVQLPLADIYVGAAVTEITQGNITNRVGTNDCPFATSLLDHVSADALIGQWNFQFYEWFNNLQDELDSNQASNLQAQIDDLEDRTYGYRNILDNGDMAIMQRDWSDIYRSVRSYKYEGSTPDRWGIRHTFAGDILPDRVLDGSGKYWYRVQVQTNSTPGSAVRAAYVEQHIEGWRMKDLLKSTADARPMTLSLDCIASVAGTYSVEIIDVPNDRHYVDQLEILPGQEDLEQSFTMLIPPDTVGSPYQPGIYEEAALKVRIWLSAGSDFSSGTTPPAWAARSNVNAAVGNVDFGANAGTTSAYFQFSNIQLEVGEQQTSFDRLNYNDSLQRCQRYFERTETIVNVSNDGDTSNVTVVLGPVIYTVPKREILDVLMVSEDGIAGNVNANIGASFFGGGNIINSTPKGFAKTGALLSSAGYLPLGLATATYQVVAELY